jgi:hypothetical protein
MVCTRVSGDSQNFRGMISVCFGESFARDIVFRVFC